MSKLFRKIGAFVAISALVLGMGLSHVQASSTKFVVEGLYEPDSTHFGIFFIPDVSGTLLTDVNITFSTSGIVTEDDLRNAQESSIVAWANGIGGYSGITTSDVIMPEKPILETVATSGLFSDLLSKPTTLSGYGITDGATTTALATKLTIPSGTTSQYVRGDGTLATTPVIQAYEGTTQRTGTFPIFKSVTVSGGTAVFNLTSDGTSGGTALFPNGVIADSVNATVSDATASYQMSWAFSNSNKTLTVTANKLTTANILTGVLGQATANGSVVKLSVWGY